MKRFPSTSIFHRWIVNFMGQHLIEGFAGRRIASSTVIVARLIHQFALLFVWELLVCHVEGAVPRTQRNRTKAVVALDQCWLVVSAQAVVAAFNGGNHAVDFSGIHLLPVPLRIVRQKTQLCGIANPNVVHNKLFWLIRTIGINFYSKNLLIRIDHLQALVLAVPIIEHVPKDRVEACAAKATNFAKEGKRFMVNFHQMVGQTQFLKMKNVTAKNISEQTFLYRRRQIEQMKSVGWFALCCSYSASVVTPEQKRQAAGLGTCSCC